MYKVNWDAAMDRLHCRVAIGVIVRYWTGQVIATLRSRRDLFPDAMLAEIVTALKAVILYNQLNL